MTRIPYQLFCTFLYGSHGSFRRIGEPGRVQVEIAEFCRWLGINSGRIRPHMEVLEEQGLITDLEFSRGYTVFKVARPALADWEQI